MPEPELPVVRLAFSEALRVGWLIAWRGALLNTLVLWLVTPVFTLGITGILTTLALPGAVVRIVVVATHWLVLPLALHILLLQMALMKQFQGFRLETQNRAGEPDDWSLKETVAPGFFLWLFGILGFLVSTPLTFFFISGGEAAQVALIPILIVSAVAAYPGAVYTLTIMRFHGRRLAVVRERAIVDPIAPSAGYAE